MQSAKAEIEFRLIMARRLTLNGSTLRTRTPEFTAAAAANLEQRMWLPVAASRLQPHVFKTFPFAEGAAAHRLMESSMYCGKIVLIPLRAALSI